MKRILLLLLFYSLSNLLPAQEVKQKLPANEDVLSVLNGMGIKMLKFDLSQFLDSRFKYTIYVDEYVKGRECRRVRDFRIGENKRFISEDSRHYFVANPDMNTESGELTLIRDMGLYFTPDTDSTINFIIGRFPEGGSVRFPLEVKIVEGLKKPMYETRPFELQSSYVGQKLQIPLCFYGSFWYDEKNKVYRMCGERVLSPLMDSEVFSDTPHGYVVGIIIEKSK